MYLYRHPREIRANKDIAGKIINKWARPIFNLQCDYSTLTKDDREQRDLEMAKKLRDVTMRRSPRQTEASKQKKKKNEPERPARPGDPGWVMRARVPMVDNKEYVVRPAWQSNAQVSNKPTAKKVTLLEKHKRAFQDKKRIRKLQHAMKISIEGSKLPLSGL